MVKAINGNVILKKVEEEETLYGQIIVPDLGKERPELGLVVGTSDSYNWNTGQWVESQLNSGDVVIIPRMGSMVVSHDGQDYIMVKETEVLGVIQK